MTSKLFAAAESIREDYAEPPAADPQDAIDGLMAQDESMELAAEALFMRACSLESLVDTIKDVPQEKATPELIAAVQANILALDEPTIATESADDVTDVEAKSGKWDKLKGHAAQAAKVAMEATRRILQSIMDFMQNIYQWVTSSRKRTAKRLAEQKDALASASAQVEIEATRSMRPLVYKENFSFDSSKQCMARYATVLTAATVGLRDVFEMTKVFGNASYQPNALNDFQKHFTTRTASAYDWKDVSGTSRAEVFDGEGGQHLSVEITGTNIAFDVSSPDEKTTALSYEFSRSDMQQLNKMGTALLAAVSKFEPEFDSLRSSVRKLLTLNTVHLYATQQNMQIKGVVKSPTTIFMEMRRHLAFANKVGVVSCVTAAHAVSSLCNTFIKGTAVKGDAPAGAGDASGIEQKLLAA